MHQTKKIERKEKRKEIMGIIKCAENRGEKVWGEKKEKNADEIT